MSNKRSRSRLPEMSEITRRSGQVVTEYPMSATFVAFGVGFTVGLLIGHALGEPLHPTRQPSMTERLGEQLLDAVASILPEKLYHHRS